MIERIYTLVVDLLDWLGNETAINTLLDTWYYIFGFGLAAVIITTIIKKLT